MSTIDHIDLSATNWQELAACDEWTTDLFYPNTGSDAGVYIEARKVCRTCPVQAECLTYALDNDERYGMWGGQTPAQREQIMRSRNATRNTRHTRALADARAKDEAMLSQYDALVAAEGTGEALARNLGISLATLTSRMCRARRRINARSAAVA